MSTHPLSIHWIGYQTYARRRRQIAQLALQILDPTEPGRRVAQRIEKYNPVLVLWACLPLLDARDRWGIETIEDLTGMALRIYADHLADRDMPQRLVALAQQAAWELFFQLALGIARDASKGELRQPYGICDMTDEDGQLQDLLCLHSSDPSPDEPAWVSPMRNWLRLAKIKELAFAHCQPNRNEGHSWAMLVQAGSHRAADVTNAYIAAWRGTLATPVGR